MIKQSGGDAARDWRAFEPLIGHGHSVAVRRVSGRIGVLRPAQIADLLEDADAAEGVEILDWVRADPELEADVFEELDPEKASRLLDDMSDPDVAALLSRMRADDAADAIVDLRQSRRRRVLDLMPAPQRVKVITLMSFNPNSAGGLMNTDVVSCIAKDSVGEVLSVIAGATAMQPEALLKAYVVDDNRRVIGAVSVITLLRADPLSVLDDVMEREPVRITPDVDLADIALLMADYNLYAVPVVDTGDHVLGVVTVDDVLEATIPDDWRRREPARPFPDRTVDSAASTHGGGGQP